jgi:hypothetical protein
MKKNSSLPGILDFLKRQGRSFDVPLNHLRHFQEFERMNAERFQALNGEHPAVQYGHSSFYKVELLAMGLIGCGEYPSVERGLSDLMSIFAADPAFDDGINIPAWLFYNFPATPRGTPMADAVLGEYPEFKDELSPFVEKALQSRLGLYEVVKSGRTHCEVKELFTRTSFRVSDGLAGVRRGTIALCRLLEFEDFRFVLGNSAQFPAERRSLLENMVSEKMSIFMPRGMSRPDSYDGFMRIAGPYWFSIMASGDGVDILDPVHHQRYYQEQAAHN